MSLATVEVQDQSVFIDGISVFLPPLERRLLSFLLLHQGYVRTKFMIFDELYPVGTKRPGHKIIDVLVCKINAQPKRAIIETRWGRGYGIALNKAIPGLVPKLSSNKIAKDIYGLPLTCHDLPQAHSKMYWTCARKAAVVQLVTGGVVPLSYVLQRYPDLAEDEFLEWKEHLRARGDHGLKTTRIL